MRNDGSPSLGWWRSLALACIVVMGLGTIVGSGGGGGDDPISSLPKFIVTPSDDTHVIGDKGGEITNERGDPLVTIPKDAHIGFVPVKVVVTDDSISVVRTPSATGILAINKPMVVTMPPSAHTPSGCPAGVSLTLSECWTQKSLEPSFFGKAWGARDFRPNLAYRLARNRLATSHTNAELRLELGSQLTSSAKDASNNKVNTYDSRRFRCGLIL